MMPPAEYMYYLFPLNNLVQHNATVTCESLFCLCQFTSYLLDKLFLARKCKMIWKSNERQCFDLMHHQTCEIDLKVSVLFDKGVRWWKQSSGTAGNVVSSFWLTFDGATYVAIWPIEFDRYCSSHDEKWWNWKWKWSILRSTWIKTWK